MSKVGRGCNPKNPPWEFPDEVEVDASPEMKHATDGTVGRTAMNPPAFSNTDAGPAAGPIAKKIAADLNECRLRQQLWQARAARPKYL